MFMFWWESLWKPGFFTEKYCFYPASGTLAVLAFSLQIFRGLVGYKSLIPQICIRKFMIICINRVQYHDIINQEEYSFVKMGHDFDIPALHWHFSTNLTHIFRNCHFKTKYNSLVLGKLWSSRLLAASFSHWIPVFFSRRDWHDAPV